jgi:type I restriction enzyme S subunit
MRVPEGWSQNRIGELCSSIVPGRNKPKLFDGDIPWVTTPEIQGRYLPSKLQKNYISSEEMKLSGGKLVPKNAVIMAAVGDLGLVAIAQQDIVINQQLHAFVCLNEVFYEYIAYWIEIQKPYMFSIASKTTIPYLNKNNCESIPVNYPPLPEQQKIAQILSTWDKAISTTEQLLANSQQQKKALMQQLLTGKKRLLDEDGVRFSGEWLNKLLGEICEISTGKSNREDSTSSSGLYTFFDRSQDIRTSNIFLFETEAVIVAGEGQEFVPKYFSGKFDLHQRTYAIMGFANSWGKFIYFYLWHFNSFLLSQAVGSTVKSLRLPMFQKMPIKLPSLKEQQKIATALSSAECEIKLLQTKLEALKQEKKALMQQLLTGKRRVNII